MAMIDKKLDEQWYLTRYPDVAQSGMSAQEHYDTFGRAEGRFPRKPTVLDYGFRVMVGLLSRLWLLPKRVFGCLDFYWNLWFRLKSVWYLDNNPDVVASGMSAAEHYRYFGWAEKRLPCPPGVLLRAYMRMRVFLDVFAIVARRDGGYGSAIKILYGVYKSEGMYGLKSRIVFIHNTEKNRLSAADYARWIATNEPDLSQLKKLYAKVKQQHALPKLSLVMATYNTPVVYLEAAVESVLGQPYENWEFCIADDASNQPETLEYLKALAERDDRIKLCFRSENGHISEATNSALALCSGDYVLFMDHDDLLHPGALLYVAETIAAHPEAGLIYSDEDKIDETNTRSAPYFKSEFNYELLLTQNVLCHLVAVKQELVEVLGGLNSVYDGAQDHDLVLRAVEQLRPDQIVHIPRVLYHWRMHSGSTAASTATKPYAIEAGRRAVQDHLTRTGVKAEVVVHPEVAFWHRVKFAVPEPAPDVDIIIPTRDRIGLMRVCVESILSKTTYPNYRITIVDNGSVERDTLEQFALWAKHERINILRDDSPFNYSRLNNQAVDQVSGAYVCLLNNDIEVISPGWLEEMVSLAAREGVGCVGTRLWYPNDRLQHGGIILGIGGVAGHAHKFLEKGQPGYFGRAVSLHAISAVTAACLLVKTSIYRQVGGLDENMKVAFNDVDFCLRVREAGYCNLWTPFAEMYHHESASRGYEDNPEKIARFQQEVRFMQKRWAGKLESDPFYSPNLTLLHEDFSLAAKARISQ